MKDDFTTLMHVDMLGWSKEDSMLIENIHRLLPQRKMPKNRKK